MIIVMSDSHGDRNIVEEIKNKYQSQASAIIHCGDSELSSDDNIWNGITVVAGNCDFDSGYKDYQILETDGKKVLVTHGHLAGVNFGLDRLNYLADEEDADIVLFGHLHRPILEQTEGKIFINPGSVSQPRGEFSDKMYCKIDLSQNGYHIQYLDTNHKPIKELEFQISYDR